MRLALLPFSFTILCVALSISQGTKSSASTFRIAVPSDLHFGELPNSYGPLQDIATAEFLQDMLRIEQPNLVILNGDLITGEDTLKEDPTRSLNVLFQPMLDAGVPWASTYGNHDAKYNLSRESLFNAEAEYPQSLTQHGPPGTDGVTNYFVPLYANGKLVVVLWFFDSRGGSDRQDNLDDIPNWVSRGTVAWFLETSKALNAQSTGALEHLVFVHIPPLPFYEAQKEFFDDGGRDAAHLFPGQNEEYPLAIQSVSGLGNNTYGGQDQAFIDALLLRNVHSIWSGHDHGVSWCSTYPKGDSWGTGLESDVKYKQAARQRPFLCFCKHTGTGGYGPWQRGIRMLDIHYLHGRVKVDTWVRLDDGGMVTKVSLNETYGKDRYPAFDLHAHNSEFLAGLRRVQLNVAQ